MKCSHIKIENNKNLKTNKNTQIHQTISYINEYFSQILHAIKKTQVLLAIKNKSKVF